MRLCSGSFDVKSQFHRYRTQNWSDVLNCYETAASSMGLHTNWIKTKIQNVGAGLAPKPVVIDNQTVESVMKFTYLGSDVDSQGYSTPEIHRHLGMGHLDQIWKQCNVSVCKRSSGCTHRALYLRCCTAQRPGHCTGRITTNCKPFT